MSTYNRVVAADSSASLAPTVRARLATEMADPTSAVGASLSSVFARGVSVKDPRYGAVGDGSADDTLAVQAAIDASGVNGAVYFPPGTYLITSTLTIATAGTILHGSGNGSTLKNSNDSVMVNITGNYARLIDLRVEVSDTARTNYPVKISGGAGPIVQRVYFHASTGARRSGVYFATGSMGTVTECVFNHSCIRVEVWDVKIDKCYVWGMSNDFCIGLFNGVGNTTITNTDVVPPLTSTATGVAGILIDGASGNSLNTKISNVYLDGNPSPVTRQGIYIGDGSGATLLSNITANKMNSDCIVIDGAYNVVVDGYSGHSNNLSGNGARDIVVKKSGAQSVEKVLLKNIQCLMTAAVTGTAGYAIEVEATVGAGQVVIRDFAIKQPGAGGGYLTPEVKVPVSGGYPTMSMSGGGQLSNYSAIGSLAVASGATSATINISTPYPIAYRPTPGQIAIQFEGTPSSAYRIQYTSDNQLYVPFSPALAAAGTIHWQVNLVR